MDDLEQELPEEEDECFDDDLPEEDDLEQEHPEEEEDAYFDEDLLREYDL